MKVSTARGWPPRGRAGGSMLAQRDLVAHEVQQAVGDPLDLGRRSAAGRARRPPRPCTAGRRRRAGRRARSRRPGAAPRRSATTRWPRRRARTGPRTRRRRASHAATPAASSARRDLPTPASPMSSSEVRPLAVDGGVDGVAEQRRARSSRPTNGVCDAARPVAGRQQRLDGDPRLDRLVPALGVDRPERLGRR